MIKRESSPELSLSARQRQLLDLLIEGKSNKEIATDLQIEPGTVKQHLFVLFRKLGVTSRAKAVIAAAQIMKSSTNDGGEAKAKTPKSKLDKHGAPANLRTGENYSWRLVSTVAISIADLADLSPNSISQRDHFLKALRDVIERLVAALDGQVTYLPGGGSVMWFGHPRAHLDDADRAVYLAQYLQGWSSRYQANLQSAVDGELSQSPLIGIGLASHTEIVAEKATELFGAESFRKAAILARHAKALKMPLADALTKQIAPMSNAWLAIQVKEGGKEVVVKEVGPIAIVGSAEVALPDASARWGGFPFLANAFESIEGGLAQWISVESWPPAAATLLIDAIGSHLSAKHFQIVRLRVPGSYRRDRALTSFAAQIELQFGNAVTRSEKIYPSQGERIAGLLAEMSKVQPLAVLVYGLKALESFKAVVGEPGIDRLASRPIMIVAANLQDTGSAQVSVRLLGSKPNSAPFSRIFTLQAPAMDALPEGIRVDLRAMLDGLSPIAKELILRAANQPDQSVLTILSAMNEPQHQVQSCIQELMTSGLIAANQSGDFELRDLATAQAIGHLSVAVSNGLADS